MKKLTMALALALVFIGARSAAAQTTNATVTVNVPQVLMIGTVASIAIAEGDFDFTGSNQSSVTTSATVPTRSNVDHVVTVEGTQSAGETGVELAVQDAATSAYAPVAGGTAVTATPVLAPGEHTTTSVNFQATADLNDAPGAYEWTITYTVIAQ